MTTYEDYKYVMQDTGYLYLGAKYNYAELIANEEVPFKLKAVLQRYILNEIPDTATLESHFYYMQPEGFVYEACKQLKIKVKYIMVTDKKTFLGGQKSVYETRTMRLEKFVCLTPREKENMGVQIQEIGISKFALMTFSI